MGSDVSSSQLLQLAQLIAANPAVTVYDAAEQMHLPLTSCATAFRTIRDDAVLRKLIDSANPNNRWRYSELIQHGHLALSEISGIEYPVELEIHPSFACPLDCWYCCSPHVYSENKTFKGDARRALLGYLEQLSGRTRTVQISGGREPLFDPELVALLNQARSYGYHTRMNTSGFTTLSANALDSIQPFLDYTAVSIDAPYRALYGRIKGGRAESAFDAVCDGVRSAASISRRSRGHIEIVTLVLDENLECLGEMADFARDLGADSIRFRRLKPHVVVDGDQRRTSGGPQRIAAARGPMPDILDLLRSVQETIAGEDFDVRINVEDFSADYEAILLDNSRPCYSSLNKLVIDAQGYVFPCALLSYPSPGNASRSPYSTNVQDYPDFADLWDALLELRKEVFHSPCADCYVADRYINNFAHSLVVSRRAGLEIETHPFATSDGTGCR